MRLKITLQPAIAKCTIPINYNYPLSSLIYDVLYKGSKKFARFMHDQGLRYGQKKLKPFTFSRLFLHQAQQIDDRLLLSGHPLNLIASSPLSDFDINLVKGLFASQTLRIQTAEFHLLSIETLPLPEFQPEMSFRALSPIVISTSVERNGKRMPYYLPPDDDRFGPLLRQNLVRKYIAYYGHLPSDDKFQFSFDAEYLQHRGKKTTRLIEIKRKHKGKATNIKVRGILAPFTVQGNPELIKFGYLCGFGEKTSLGFGCAEVMQGSNSNEKNGQY